MAGETLLSNPQSASYICLEKEHLDILIHRKGSQEGNITVAQA